MFIKSFCRIPFSIIKAFSFVSIIKNIFVWGYDGITFPECDLNIENLNAIIREKTGFNTVEFVIKTFDIFFLSRFLDFYKS
jgi:hypothetical protein